MFYRALLNIVQKMSCNYAEGLSSYENKGVLGLPEVNSITIGGIPNWLFMIVSKFSEIFVEI